MNVSVLRTISEASVPLPKGLDSSKALRGFLIMLNRTGKLLHVSDNASEYLGHSIVGFFFGFCSSHLGFFWRTASSMIFYEITGFAKK